MKYKVIVKVGGRFHSIDYEKPHYNGGSPWFIHNVKPFQFTLQELLQVVHQMMGEDYTPSLIWFYSPGEDWPGCLKCIKGNEDMNKMWTLLTADEKRSRCSIYIQDVETDGTIRDGKVKITYTVLDEIEIPERRLELSGYIKDALVLQHLDDEIGEADKEMMYLHGDKWYITR